MSRLPKKLRALWRRRQLDRDLEDELRFHLDMKAEETGDYAVAQRRVGNLTQLKEDCRELWSFSRVESWGQDIRYAARMLGKARGFTLVAVLALALGIGADTAVFTIVHGAFAWNLGLDHVDEFVTVGLTDATHEEGFFVSYPDFRYLATQTKTLAGLAAYRMTSANLSDTRTLPDREWCVEMSVNGFEVSEQKPVLGRGFTEGDARPGAPAVVELTYHVWQDRYGKDPGILGKTIRVNDVPMIVVGVMPPGKRFPEDTDLWTPLRPDERMERPENRSVALFGRLADGSTIVKARAELSAIASGLAELHPGPDRQLSASVRSIAAITGAYGARPLFAALWAAVGFVLLIACADVANMLLARGTGRMREISIRVAIGAGRARIVRQLLVESMLLSIAGGFFGWLVAMGGLRWFDWGTRAIAKPLWLHLTLDGTAFVYLAGVSLATGILFGLAPALRLARVDVHTAIKDGGQGVTNARRALSIANLLVVFEMALCIVLLTGAGLMIRSTVNLYGAPIGVNTNNVLTMRVTLSEAKYPLVRDQVEFHRALQGSVDSLPGVEASGAASDLPLQRWESFAYEFEGARAEPGRSPRVGAIIATPGYFRVMEVKPRRGHTFSETDGVAGAPVVVVNETFAKKFWPGENALGRRLRLVKDSAQPWMTIVGVIPDILQNGRRPLEHDPLIYLPYAQEPQREMFLVTKTRVPAGTLANALRTAAQKIDPNLAVYDVRSLENHLAETRLSVTLLSEMFSVFAAVALLLAAVGLYAVISHSVQQRTQEIGVRMAVGGTRRDILRLVFVQGMRPLGFGIALGLPAAFGVTHVLRTQLIGVAPGDPVTLLSVIVVLAAAGIAGCAVPAYRAIRVDPIVALRYE